MRSILDSDANFLYLSIQNKKSKRNIPNERSSFEMKKNLHVN